MDADNQPKPKNLASIISPCILASLFCVYVIIDSYMDMKHSKGWSFLGVIYGVVMLVVLVLSDAFLRFLCKGKVGMLWAIEILLIAAIALYIYNQ